MGLRAGQPEMKVLVVAPVLLLLLCLTLSLAEPHKDQQNVQLGGQIVSSKGEAAEKAGQIQKGRNNENRSNPKKRNRKGTRTKKNRSNPKKRNRKGTRTKKNAGGKMKKNRKGTRTKKNAGGKM